jgi:ABC-type protease/lipase transport system fused ATPase/permease subunit
MILQNGQIAIYGKRDAVLSQLATAKNQQKVHIH